MVEQDIKVDIRVVTVKLDFSRKVNSKAKKNIASKGNQVPEWPRWSSGSTSLDVELGGGLPTGKIIGIVGEYSAGKTALALIAVGEYQKKFKEFVVWIDAEGAWDPRWAKTLGVDIAKVDVVRPQYGEQAYDIALAAYDEGAGLVVLDSAAALASKKELEGSMETIEVGGMSKIHAKFMRKLDKDWEEVEGPQTFIYLNQFIQNISGYGPPLIEKGGEALTKYFPSVKIILKAGDYYDGKKSYSMNSQIDDDTELKAQVIKFFIEKNKTAPPKRKGFFWFYFDNLDDMRRRGTIDRLDEIIRLSRKYGVVEQSVSESGKKGSIFTLLNEETGEVRTFKGANALAEFIRENDSAREYVERTVLKRVIGDMSGDEDEEKTRKNGVQEDIMARTRRVLEVVKDLDLKEGEESSEAV